MKDPSSDSVRYWRGFWNGIGAGLCVVVVLLCVGIVGLMCFVMWRVATPVVFVLLGITVFIVACGLIGAKGGWG